MSIFCASINARDSKTIAHFSAALFARLFHRSSMYIFQLKRKVNNASNENPCIYEAENRPEICEGIF
ncbi:hypothetical protein ACHAWU_008321 [Discostella pseudostelligera]|uniref:Uncharacterized protein n=1 Tax=Discostella pseudostelligera TaxID=259834 RepID=A0ABD3M4M1_9STRA